MLVAVHGTAIRALPVLPATSVRRKFLLGLNPTLWFQSSVQGDFQQCMVERLGDEAHDSRGRRAFTRPRIGGCADNEARNVETFPDHDGGVDTVVMAPQTNIH